MTLPDEIIKRAMEKLQTFEGFEARAYKDSAYRDPKTGQIKNRYSIGYGHQILPGEEHLLQKTLTKEEATDLLKQDVAKHLGWRSAVTRDISTNQAVALTLLEYNAGPARSKQVASLLNRGKVQEAADLFFSFTKSFSAKTGQYETLRGLTKRRAYERNLFLTPDSSPVSPLTVAQREPNKGGVRSDATSNVVQSYISAPTNRQQQPYTFPSVGSTKQAILQRLKSIEQMLGIVNRSSEAEVRAKIRKEAGGL